MSGGFFDVEDELEAETAMQAEQEPEEPDANELLRHKINEVKRLQSKVTKESAYGDWKEEEEEAEEVEEESKLEQRFCVECGMDSYSLTFFKTFDKAVCNACKKKLYPMVTKSTAKERFFCTDAQLAGLRCLARKNPRKPTWAPMKLFLESEVRALTAELYADEDALEKEKQKRNLLALEKRLAKTRKKRKVFLPTGGSQRKKPAPMAKAHVHTFVAEGDVETCSECGITVEVEEF